MDATVFECGKNSQILGCYFRNSWKIRGGRMTPLPIHGQKDQIPDLFLKSLQGDIFLIANALEKDSFHKSHVHYDCLVSGVWYLQVPEASAPLEFEDPVFARTLYRVPILDETNPHTWQNTYLYPKEGYYTCFPNWIRHSVLPNDSMDSRIAISWNIR